MQHLPPMRLTRFLPQQHRQDGRFGQKLSLDDKLPPFIIELGNMIVKYFSKCVTIDKNKTNNKFKIVIQQKQDADYIAVKKYTSLTAEDVLTVKGR